MQGIADRANVARTTFYLHYSGKDDLFMHCHEAMVGGFQYPHSREEMLAAKPPPGMVAAYRHLAEARALFDPIFQGRDLLLILRRIRDWSAQEIAASLREAFGKTSNPIPLDVLAHYLAGAQIALVQWWLEKRQPVTPEDLARAFHRLQRAALRDAFGLNAEE